MYMILVSFDNPTIRSLTPVGNGPSALSDSGWGAPGSQKGETFDHHRFISLPSKFPGMVGVHPSSAFLLLANIYGYFAHRP